MLDSKIYSNKFYITKKLSPNTTNYSVCNVFEASDITEARNVVTTVNKDIQVKYAVNLQLTTGFPLTYKAHGIIFLTWNFWHSKLIYAGVNIVKVEVHKI